MGFARKGLLLVNADQMVTQEFQVGFLQNLQRLLSEGSFVATYKYALLLSLADILIEHGGDSGEELEIPTRWIAEKFIAYYWRQTTPFVPKDTTVEQSILLQNTGRQAAVVSKIADARAELGSSLACARDNAQIWSPLIKQVDSTVRTIPLWKLQTVGSESFDFLYPNFLATASLPIPASKSANTRSRMSSDKARITNSSLQKEEA